MDVQAYINELCNRIVDRFSPHRVILFGSYAYGVPNLDSDIDLLVVMPFEDSPHAQAVKIRRELESSMPLDILARTPEQIRERLEMKDFFMRKIVEQGRVLYEGDHA